MVEQWALLAYSHVPLLLRSYLLQHKTQHISIKKKTKHVKHVLNIKPHRSFPQNSCVPLHVLIIDVKTWGLRVLKLYSPEITQCWIAPRVSAHHRPR